MVLNEAINAIVKLGSDLERYIEQNTKREIKDIQVKLKRQTEILQRHAIQNWIRKHKYEEIQKMTHDVDCQATPTDTKECSTQTIDCSGLAVLPTIGSYAEWVELVDRTWDEDLFKNTEVKEGNPLICKDAVVRVTITESTENETDSFHKLFIDKYPELEMMKEDYGVLEQSVTLKTSNRKEVFDPKIIQIKCNGEEENLFEKLCMVKNELEDREWIALHEVGSVEGNRFRKLVEGIFHDTGTKVIIYSNARKKQPRTYATAVARERKTFGIIVGDKNNSYNETLKQVKTAMSENKINKGIQGIRSIRDGKVLITMDKNEAVMASVEKALKTHTKTSDSDVLKLGETDMRTHIHIRGMDSITTKEEIQTCIKDILKLTDDEELRTSELRPNANNTQAITVTLRKKDAAVLIEHKYIRIGYSNCRVEERVNVTRCRRCWEYGHNSANCQAEDRSKNCFKCGQEGHIGKDCKNDDWCPLCKLKHKAGSGKCESFKRSLSIARKQVQSRHGRPVLGEQTPLKKNETRSTLPSNNNASEPTSK